MDWSAGQYRLFEDERTRPARDLAGAVPGAPKRIVDLGCGPGNSTEVLIARYPDAAVSGIDSSADMVADARRRLPTIAFEQADIADWSPEGPTDLLYSNAVFQWIERHDDILPRLIGRLAPQGSLAIQMPDNLDEPSHVSMRVVARAGPWAEALAPADAARTDIATPDGYFRMLKPHARRVDIWRTIYHHPLKGLSGIVEWFKGSGLRPYLSRLTEGERADYLARYESELARHYPVHADGTTLLAFPRLFIVATR